MENNSQESSTTELKEPQTPPVSKPQVGQYQQTTPPVGSSPSIKKLLIIVGILLGFVLFYAGGYMLGMQRDSQANIVDKTTTTPTQSPTTSLQPSPIDSVPNPTTTSEVINEWTKFTHPAVGYAIEYPANWTGRLNEIPEVIEQDYQDFYIESPNHQVSKGYPVLENGAEFFVRVEKTQYSTIEEIFNNDPLAPEIAFDKTTTKVDGLGAIQYDYNYEGHRATMTIFTKNGNYYTVKYRYVNNQSRQTNWNDYIKLLSSFKIK